MGVERERRLKQIPGRSSGGVDPTTVAGADVAAIVPHGVANAVLLRLARLPPAATALARALSVLGECTQVGDAARLAGLAESDVETALGWLISARSCFIRAMCKASSRLS